MFEEFLAHKMFPMMPRGMAEAVTFVSARVKTAPRFVLDRHSTIFLQNLSQMPYKQIVAALPVCRLPFSKIWVEMAFADRSAWLAEGREHGLKVTTNDFSSEPKRLGFLLEEAPPPYGKDFLIVQLAWSHEEPAIDVSRKAILIDLRVGRFDDEQYLTWRREAPDAIKNHGCTSVEDAISFYELSERVKYFVPPHCELLWEDIARMGMTEKFEEMANFDLASEWRFMLTMLIALNSRNLLKTGETENFEKLNKSRVKKGRAPLLDYRTIKLSLSPILQKRMGQGYYNPSDRNKSDPHLVRAHWKIRKTGIFLWSSHERGGHVTKPPTIRVTA